MLTLQSIYLEVKTIPPSRAREIPKEIDAKVIDVLLKKY